MSLPYVMIQSFKCDETARIHTGELSRKFPSQIQAVAFRKLVQLDISTGLNDLKIPPGNRLEALKNNRKGQHSIRINKQWRVCFIWRDDEAHEVEIVDYH